MDPNNNYPTGNPPYPPPTQPRYDQPSQPGYGQPAQPGYGQPMQPGYGQPHPGYDPNGYNPYAAAAPAANYYNPNLYPSTGSASNGHGQRFKTSFVFSFIVGMIAFSILSSFITLMIWLFFRPGEWPEFRVDSASASGFNLDMDSKHLNGKLDVVFTVRNPNDKYGIVYEPLKIVMLYKYFPMTDSKIEAFDQSTKSETTVPVNFVASSEIVPYVSRKQTQDQIHMDFLATGWIKYKSNSWRTTSHSIRVYCNDIIVRMSPNNTKTDDALLSGQKTCRVSSKLWII
ncbi:Yls9-like [Thalictrum thalictroides]|uniref:Yls9-like n=1 Tax=Thalictrum thalictroides TaxID=46969 RepID=A0A7J6WID9_THATH|nr:Yls9-like [Thalictrum thalictroides]